MDLNALSGRITARNNYVIWADKILISLWCKVLSTAAEFFYHAYINESASFYAKLKLEKSFG